MALVPATLTNISWPEGNSRRRVVPVMFNPTEYSITTNMSFADINVPGLRVPLIQFVRGEAQTLSAELFLDRTDTGVSLRDDLNALRSFVTIDNELHAPPVCRFKWGDVDQFDGVVTGFTERFLLFDESGNVLRARVTITLRSYQPANLQYRDIDLRSPDRTKTRVIRENERLDHIADEEYGDPGFWRVLATHNNIDSPRLLRAGDVLTVPPLPGGGT